jgi:hypothetical protein
MHELAEAAAEALQQFPAVRECIPKRGTSAELRTFRQAWGIDDGHGKASRVLASGWVAWEFCGLGVWLRDQVDGETRDAQMRLVSWRRRLASHYWSDFLTAATDARREAFDALAEGDAGPATAPALDPAMRSAERGLFVEIGDRWLQRLDWIEARERAAGGLDPQEVDRACWEIRAVKSQMLADLGAVVRFETSPAHWEPTPAQLTRLPPAWRRRFEFKEALANYVGFGWNPPEGIADAREALARLRAEMAGTGPRTAAGSPG